MCEEERNNKMSYSYILKIIGDMVYMSHATDLHGQAVSHILDTPRE